MNQEQLQKVLEAISKSGVSVNGDLVLEKKVEYEVNNVENGGIGIQIVNNEDKTSLTKSDADIQSGIDELLKAKDDDGNLLFRNKKQWWAVYRVLFHFCNYPSQMTAFVTKMKNMKVANIDTKRCLSYDSLVAAAKDVPKMATCSPSTWDAYKEINDNYKQQYNVAEWLMLKMGIKS